MATVTTGTGGTATSRLHSKPQTLDDAYAPPANFLELEVANSITHGIAKNRFTDYEVRMKVCTYVFQYVLGIKLPQKEPIFILDKSANIST